MRGVMRGTIDEIGIKFSSIVYYYIQKKGLLLWKMKKQTCVIIIDLCNINAIIIIVDSN